MNIKAVVIDLDGTLLNDKRKVGEKDIKTLIQTGEKTIVRIIATGRSLYSFNEVINEDFPIDYLIFAAGAGIMNFKTKEICNSYSIKAVDTKKIALRLNELKIDFQIREKIPNGHKYSYKKYSPGNPDFDRINSKYKSHIKKLNDINGLADSSRIICISEDDKNVKIIEKEFNKFSIIRATSPIDNKSVWMEIYPKGVNKGCAVKNLCNKLKINLSDTIGIGNDYNDIHFLDITGESYIVSGAPDDLKLKYQVICSNNLNPLSYIINQ